MIDHPMCSSGVLRHRAISRDANVGTLGGWSLIRIVLVYHGPSGNDELWM